MRVRRQALAVTALALAAALPGSTVASASPKASGSGVHAVTLADGRTMFADVRGRTLQLRGFNVDKYDETTEADVRAIAAHGFTLLRVATTWARLEPQQGRYDRAAEARLERVLDWADRYGLRVVVDFHQDVYGPEFGTPRGSGDDGAPAWATRDDGLPFTPDPSDWFAGYFQPAVQRAFRHLYDDPDLRAAQAVLYAHVARELRGHRALLGYDLFNEPSGPIDGDPTDPAVQVAASAQLEQGRLAAMYRRLIAAVRSQDRDAWLFVEPTVLVGEGVPTKLPGFTDPRGGEPRIGYAPHFYDTAVEAGQDWNPQDGFVEAYTAAITAYPQRHRMPVLVGEWGPPNATTPGNAELISRQVAAMQGFAAGWTLWYWGRGTGGYTPLDPAGVPHPGDAQVFAPYAAAVAGTVTAEQYDPATRGYTLRLTAARSGAATRIVLPPSVYASGVRVAVTGGRVLRLVAPEDGRHGDLWLVPGRPGEQLTVTLRPV